MPLYLFTVPLANESIALFRELIDTRRLLLDRTAINTFIVHQTTKSYHVQPFAITTTTPVDGPDKIAFLRKQ